MNGQIAPDVDRVSGLPDWKRSILPGILLFGLVVWTFLPAIHNGFINYDDNAYLTDNGRVQQGLTWENFKWAFQTGSVSNWHPMTWLSHMTDCQLFGLEPWGHHLTSVLVHALNAGLLFRVLQRLTGAVWRSLLVAAIFGLHPLRVESVAWVAERKDVLSALFGLLALLMYARYARSVCKAGPRCARPDTHSVSLPDHHGSTLDYLLALFFFALALMSKPMLVTLPFVLLLLDYWPLGRFSAGSISGDGLAELPTVHDPGGAGLAGPDATQRVPTTTTDARQRVPTESDATPVLRSSTAEDGQRVPTRTADTQVGPTEIEHSASGIEHPLSRLRLLVREKAPFFVFSAACGVTAFLLQKKGGSLTEMAGVAPGVRVENALLAYCGYLGKLFWPANLSVIYPVVDPPPAGPVLLAVLVLAGISTLAIVRWRKQPCLLTGWCWYLGTLVPVIGLVAIGLQTMADRYTYIPSIGVAVMWVWGVHAWLRTRVCRQLTSLAAVGMIVACIALTRHNLGYWQSTETLFRHAIASTTKNYRACWSLGNELLKQHRLYEAAKVFEAAVSFRPDVADAYNNLGVVYGLSDRLPEAVVELKEAARLNPADARTRFTLGKALERNGQLDEAIREYQEAQRLQPDFAVCYSSLGYVYFKQGRLDEALIQFREAVRLDPRDELSRHNLEAVQRMKGP